jgi:nucleoside-diphosphate-sugar epimerase
VILVTGSSGLTGSFVVDALVRRGERVRAMVRDPAKVAPRDGVEVVAGDLGEPESVRRAAAGAGAIVHTACTYTDRRIDIAAMEALLAGWGGGPFVYLSSLDVYGITDDVAIGEDHALDSGMNDYAAGKVACEELLAAAGRSDYTALRAPYIWGPHPVARGRLVKQRLLDGVPIVLPGATEAEWSRYRDVWIDVRDLAAIVLACLACPAGGPLNVLAGHFVWHDLYAELIALTGSRSELVHRPLEDIGDDELPNKRVYARTWQFSAAALERHLSWSPAYSLSETLTATVRSAAPPST